MYKLGDVSPGDRDPKVDVYGCLWSLVVEKTWKTRLWNTAWIERRRIYVLLTLELAVETLSPPRLDVFWSWSVARTVKNHQELSQTNIGILAICYIFLPQASRKTAPHHQRRQKPWPRGRALLAASLCDSLTASWTKKAGFGWREKHGTKTEPKHWSIEMHWALNLGEFLGKLLMFIKPELHPLGPLGIPVTMSPSFLGWSEVVNFNRIIRQPNHSNSQIHQFSKLKMLNMFLHVFTICYCLFLSSFRS